MKKYMTPKEFAGYIGKSRDYVYRMKARGEIPVLWLDRAKFSYVVDVEKYFSTRKSGWEK